MDWSSSKFIEGSEKNSGWIGSISSEQVRTILWKNRRLDVGRSQDHAVSAAAGVKRFNDGNTAGFLGGGHRRSNFTIMINAGSVSAWVKRKG